MNGKKFYTKVGKIRLPLTRFSLAFNFSETIYSKILFSTRIITNVKTYTNYMKVQKRNIGDYQQLYITLPAKLCEAMNPIINSMT